MKKNKKTFFKCFICCKLLNANPRLRSLSSCLLLRISKLFFSFSFEDGNGECILYLNSKKCVNIIFKFLNNMISRSIKECIAYKYIFSHTKIKNISILRKNEKFSIVYCLLLSSENCYLITHRNNILYYSRK